MLAPSMTFTAQWLTEALGGKWNGRTGKARCPLHDDRTPSMSIMVGQKHEVVVHCFVCDQGALVDKLRDMGKWPPKDDRPWSPPVLTLPPATNGHVPDDDSSDDDIVWPDVTPIRRIGPITYQYRDEHGAVLYEKVRFEPKRFSQQRPDGTQNLDGVRRVLYRLPELLASPDAPVWLCEGEKDADNVAALGLVATTSTDGANQSWSDVLRGHWSIYAQQLAGRDVIILPDNDDVGRSHAIQIHAALLGVARTVRVLQIEGLADKGDVSDWIAAGGTREQLESLASSIGVRFRLLTPSELLTLPDPEFLATDWLVQGTLSCFYGPTGVGKSFAVLDLVFSIASGTEWLGSIPTIQGTVVYVAAEGVGGLKARMRAWQARHPDADLENHVRFLTCAVNLLEAPEILELIADIRVQCHDPVLVVFDTLARSMPGGDENTAKDMNMVVAAADAVRLAFKSHVLVVHHTGKNGEDERGSSALRGAVDTSIYILRNENGGGIVMRCIKQKDSVEPSEINLKLVQVENTESCVLEQMDVTGEMSEGARKLLAVLSTSFPIEEGASTAAWLKASGSTERTFYRARTILIQNKFVVKDGRMAPNRITTWGCRDLEIDPENAIPVVTATTATELPWQ